MTPLAAMPPRTPRPRMEYFVASSAMAEVWFSQELWTGGAGGRVFRQRLGLAYKLQSTATARRRFWVCRFMCPPVNTVIRPKVMNFNFCVFGFVNQSFVIF